MARDFEWHSKDLLVTTPEDAQDITDALLIELPEIKFVDQDPSNFLIDEEESAWAYEVNARIFRRRVGNLKHWYQPPWPVVRSPAPNEPVPYYSSLADLDRYMFTGWIEPEGWVPEWELNPSYYWRPKYRLVNEPSCQFDYWRSRFSNRLPEADLPVYTPTPIEVEDDVPVYLDANRTSISFYTADQPKRHLYRTVWRILDALTTDALVAVHWKTQKPVYPVISSPHNYIGFHAIEWASRRTLNYLPYNYKPLFCFEERDFAPEHRDYFRKVRDRWNKHVEKRDRFLARMAKKRAAQKKPAPEGGGQAKG